MPRSPETEPPRTARRAIDGHEPRSWARALDARVGPSAERHLRGRFLDSVRRDLATAVIWLDTAALPKTGGDRLDPVPISAGMFTQGSAHARHGYRVLVPASTGLPAFRRGRQARGIVASSGGVHEISLRKAIGANELATLRVDRETDDDGAQ